ncbi:MAG: PQQ-dependent sugar dehydrogenase [Candidatus Pacearchaeota archaeon]|nr:PQQ-dependent sugar dehydrogenase [Candidatus Pacearchaeota archaeon]
MQNKVLIKILIIIGFFILIIGGIYLFYPKQEVISSINLELIAEGFNSPVYLISPHDESSRIFVVDRVGVIQILGEDGYFLDLRDKMVNLRETFDERGLLSLAFHPDFKNNGRFFVYYSTELRESASQDFDHTSRISEFRVDEFGNADINSEKIILEVDEPQFNHDGGQIIFGPDNYLYIALGDGGQANDEGVGHSEIGNGQDIDNLLGSILRVNIDTEPYGIPEDNPFVGKDGRDEIYAYGFRNPFRMSFDFETEKLFVGDVGQNLWEEVNIVDKGKNYGWNIKEGMHCFSIENPDESPETCREFGYNNEELINPIIEYKNANAENGIGLSVIGGFVYRGEEIPEYYGKYIFGDWSDSFISGKGKIFVAEEKLNKWEIINSSTLDSFVLGLGQDSKNEIYVLTSKTTGPIGNTGKIYKIIRG